MPSYIFDIETNGLLDELTHLHCLVLKDIDTGRVYSFSDAYDPVGTARHPRAQFPCDIRCGLEMLAEADLLIGHNVIKFDIPAIQKVYPEWSSRALVRDTITMSRLFYPDLKDRDFRAFKAGKIPGKIVGQHGLAAWGHRLGNYKGDYDGGWETWSPEMQAYCEQDVEVTFALWKRMLQRKAKDGWSDECVALEHDVQRIVARQERRGFAFDEAAAVSLLSELTKRHLELAAALQAAFPPWEQSVTIIPKANNSRFGYQKGVPFEKKWNVVFNPASRDHIADRLTAIHGWQPAEFTETGKPRVDDEVLAKLPWPEAKLLAEYLMIEKRMGQLSTGREAWLKAVKAGRIHGQVDTNGAHTGRMTHKRPNMAQVPSVKAPYGKQCRGLFKASDGMVLVGCDADALELRCLAGYMARYDGGAYIETVLRGDKAKGTDMHSVNCRGIGMDPAKPYPVGGKVEPGREIAKTWFYAFIYGAGDEKLGATVGVTGPKTVNRRGYAEDPKARERGRRDKAKFLAALPALGELVERVQEKVEAVGHIKGLDGRLLFIRSKHAALNTLLQSAGAILMKRALVILDDALQAAGLIPGKDYELVASVHDEWQIEALEVHADFVGKQAKAAIQAAGTYYNFRCPLDGNYVIGRTWSDTH